MRGVVVALGNFDGVHLGHQEVLRRAVEEGRRRGMKVVAATFHPHPRAGITASVSGNTLAVGKPMDLPRLSPGTTSPLSM